jgi:hypothetical protein
MVRSCESEKKKTDAVIRSWETKTGNTIAKFVEILKESKPLL